MTIVDGILAGASRRAIGGQGDCEVKPKRGGGGEASTRNKKIERLRSGAVRRRVLLCRSVCLYDWALVTFAHAQEKERKPRHDARRRPHLDRQGDLKKSHDHSASRDSPFQRKDIRLQIGRQIYHRAKSLEVGLRLERKKPDVGAETLNAPSPRRPTELGRWIFVPDARC